MNRRHFLLAAASAAAPALAASKVEDITLYEDPQYYAAFPSIVRLKDKRLYCAFRRAPDRRKLGETRVTHADPNSYLVAVASSDNGRTWSKTPSLIYAHPYGGSQDPCLLALRDGSLLCASYAWFWVNKDAGPKTSATASHNTFDFMGGYLVRSTDSGKTWSEPIVPPPVPGRDAKDIFGRPLPVYNRGAMVQGRDGRVFWAIAYPRPDGLRTEIHLATSSDGGLTWKYSCPIASEPGFDMNETSLYETPAGDLVAFVRTEKYEDQTLVVRSRDGGRSFEKWKGAGWQGHPHHALRLSDNRVFLAYGYRHKPFGVRARILDAECTNFASAPETVLRDDGGTGDLGYPWSVELDRGRVLTVYYFNRADGVRTISGTITKTS